MSTTLGTYCVPLIEVEIDGIPWYWNVNDVVTPTWDVVCGVPSNRDVFADVLSKLNVVDGVTWTGDEFFNVLEKTHVFYCLSSTRDVIVDGVHSTSPMVDYFPPTLGSICVLPWFFFICALCATNWTSLLDFMGISYCMGYNSLSCWVCIFYSLLLAFLTSCCSIVRGFDHFLGMKLNATCSQPHIAQNVSNAFHMYVYLNLFHNFLPNHLIKHVYATTLIIHVDTSAFFIHVYQRILWKKAMSCLERCLKHIWSHCINTSHQF